MNEIKMSSNKSFGLVFFIFFVIIGIYPLINYQSVRIWALVFAFIFLILGLTNSNILTPLNKIWFKFGIFLGKFVSPIIMALIFFFVVTPTAFFVKIFKKDLLNLKFNNQKSYWIKKNEHESKMKNQF